MRSRSFIILAIGPLVLCSCASQRAALEVDSASTEVAANPTADGLTDDNLCAELRSASEYRGSIRAANIAELSKIAVERPDEIVNVAIGLTQRVDIASVRRLAGPLAIREMTAAFDGFVDGTTLRGTQRPKENEPLDSTVQRLRENLLFDLAPRKTDEVVPGERFGRTDSPQRKAAIDSTRRRIESGELPIAGFRVEGPSQTIELLSKDPLVYSVSVGQPRAMFPLDPASRRVEEAAC